MRPIACLKIHDAPTNGRDRLAPGGHNDSHKQKYATQQPGTIVSALVRGAR